jgi:hypothetical protein
MGIVRKFNATARWIENVAEEEAPRPDPQDAQPPAPAEADEESNR